MKKITGTFLLFFLIVGSSLLAQNERFTLSGYIEDFESGEKLIAASVFVPEIASGTVSNNFGFYSLTLPKGTYEIKYSYIGYQTQTITIELNKNVEQNIQLSASLELTEVQIVAETAEKIEEKTQMSAIEIPVKEIKKLPALLGEVDVLKVIQLLPGVQSGTEGTSGIYVRGGGPDQNLILLDGVPVYNVSHLGGFFSVFNADAVSNVELIKGGFPARYGGRLSSVVNINLKEGNKNELKAAGSIGLISSKLTVEGPIGKQKKTSFIVSGRRTYIDLLTRPIIAAAGKSEDSYSFDGVDYNTENKGAGGYFFYDLNAKINHQVTDKDRVYLSFYSGRDIGSSKSEYSSIGKSSNGTLVSESNDSDEFTIDWGNLITSLRWNHEFTPRLFANSTLTLSRYNFKTGNVYEGSYFNINKDQEGEFIDTSDFQDYFDFSYGSKVFDLGGKIDFDFIPTPDHYIKFGTNFTHHTFLPGELKFKEEYANFSVDTSFAAKQINANEIFAYIEDDYKINSRLKVNFGLHTSMFDVQDTTYFSLEPRISARYLVTPDLSIKGSFVRMTQYLHLLTNASLSLPTDLWVPPTNKVGPQRSWQVALGGAKTYKDVFEISVEGYYKEITDLLAYKEGTSITLLGDDWENGVTVGDGKSYGAELFIQKKKGRTTGWIGYTLSWATRHFPGKLHGNIPGLYFEPLNFGEEFPYKYDRRHDMSIAVTHKLNDKWDLSGAFVFGTGNAITLPAIEYNGYTNLDRFFGDGRISQSEGRNSHRLPPYHRLDFSATMKAKPKKWGTAYWNFSVYNTYNRKNIFFVYEDNSYQINPRTGELEQGYFKQISLFTIIPSVSYQFEIDPQKRKAKKQKQ